MTVSNDRAKDIAERTRDFTGRAWLFAEIDHWCADPTAPNLLLLTGEPGIGKTAIAARLAQIRRVDALHFCIARQAETIEPLGFTRRLAEQLAGIDSFAQELLAEYGVNLTIRQEVGVNHGQVIGAQIGALVLGERTATVAFARTVLAPLRRLYAHGYAQPLLLVIDALDEAATLAGRETIVRLLAETGELPRPVRLLLTTRPEPAVLRHFEGAPYRLLDAGSGENQADVRRYIGAQLAAHPTLTAQVAAAGLDAPTFTERVAAASRGNFLYLVWLLPAIARGEQPLANRAALPAGLDGIYRAFLRNRTVGQDQQRWRTHYRPLLALLAAAQAPLTRGLLADLSGLAPQELDDSLRDLHQFFDPALAAREQYRLYHASLTDFLGDRARAKDFWIDLPATHRHIAQHYWQRHADDWTTCDPYGLASLATHLYASGDHARLHALFADDTWLQVRVAHDDYRYDGYMADLSQAWRVAHEGVHHALNGEEASRQLAASVHYALIRTTINSLSSNYHPALVARAVQTGLWSINRALSTTSKVVSPEKRATMLTALLATARGNAEQRVLAATQALETSLALPDENSRTQVLSNLAPHLTGNLLDRGLAAALALQDERCRAEALAALAPHLADQQRTYALECGLAAAVTLQDEWRRAEALATLTPSLTTDLLDRVLAITLALQDESCRAETLATLTPHLTTDLIERVLTAALTLHDKKSYARLLASLAPYLTNNLLERGLIAALALQDEGRCVQTLAALASHLTGDLLERGLVAAFVIEDEGRRLYAVASLVPQLTDQQRTQALEAGLTSALSLQDEWRRAQALIALAPQLTGNLLERGLVAAFAIKDERRCARVLIALAPRLTDCLLERGLAAALTMSSEKNRAELLAALAPQLSSDLLARALAATFTIQSEGNRTWVLTALGPHLPADLIEQGLAAALTIQDQGCRAEVLAALAPYLSGDLLECDLTAILALQDEGTRTWALTALAPHLSGDLLARGLATAFAIQDEECRTWALTALDSDLSNQDGAQALYPPDAATLTTNQKTSGMYTLGALVPLLTHPLPPASLADTLAIQDEWRRASALAALAPHLTTDQRAGVLDAALALREEWNRAQVLAALAPHLSGDQFARTLTAALAFQGENHRATLLIYFLERMPDLWTIRHAAQTAIADHLWRNLQTQHRRAVLEFLSEQLIFWERVPDPMDSNAIAQSVIDICSQWRWLVEPQRRPTEPRGFPKPAPNHAKSGTP